MEDDKAVDLLAHDVDPYEDAMRDDPDGGFHTFVPSKPQSFDPNILHDEVCIHFTCLFSFKLVLYLLINTLCLPRLSVSVVFFIWIVSMTGIVFRQQDVVMWMWQLRGCCSVNFLFFELSCEILCERNLLFIVFRKLEVVRY
jgi:hypothetical protein